MEKQTPWTLVKNRISSKFTFTKYDGSFSEDEFPSVEEARTAMVAKKKWSDDWDWKHSEAGKKAKASEFTPVE